MCRPLTRSSTIQPTCLSPHERLPAQEPRKLAVSERARPNHPAPTLFRGQRRSSCTQASADTLLSSSTEHKRGQPGTVCRCLRAYRSPSTASSMSTNISRAQLSLAGRTAAAASSHTPAAPCQRQTARRDTTCRCQMLFEACSSPWVIISIHRMCKAASICPCSYGDLTPSSASPACATSLCSAVENFQVSGDSIGALSPAVSNQP